MHIILNIARHETLICECSIANSRNDNVTMLHAPYLAASSKMLIILPDNKTIYMFCVNVNKLAFAGLKPLLKIR